MLQTITVSDTPVNGFGKIRDRMAQTSQARDVFAAIVAVFRAIDHVHSSGALATRAGVELDRGLHPVLATIGADGPIRSTALAEALALSPSTVSRHVARLEQMGVVERLPDRADARASLVVLTESGRQALDTLNTAWEEIIAEEIAAAELPDPGSMAAQLASLCAALSSLTPQPRGAVPGSVPEPPRRGR
jgi:DNA-binding MarR family transcriptional regulator